MTDLNSYILIECTDKKVIYGIINSELRSDYLQEEINKAKKEYDEHNLSYTIDDIVNCLNKKGFEVEFIETNKTIEI